MRRWPAYSVAMDSAKFLIALAVVSAVGGLVLQAPLHANVFDLMLARYLLLGGVFLGSIGFLMWLAKR